jgi:hypothetical protein
MIAQESAALTINPYISRIFLECSFDTIGSEGNVLVVEMESREKEHHLDEVLMSLERINNAARYRLGEFERIDIRFV